MSYIFRAREKDSAISNSYINMKEGWNHYGNDFLLPLKKHRLWE